MFRAIALILALLLPLGAFAQAGPKPGAPNPILFITAVSSEERAFLMEQAFATAWAERDPGAEIFNFRFAAYSFPPSSRAYDLTGGMLAERLAPRAPRLIVAQGDNSIDLAVQCRDRHFPGAPIVGFEATDKMRYFYEGTGGLYLLNIHDYTKENLRFARRLFPSAPEAYLLARTGPDTEAYGAIVDELRGEHPGLRLAAVMNPTMATVDATLRAAAKGAFVILLAPGWADEGGRQLVGKELIGLIEGRYGLPVFSYIREFLGEGLVGGVGVTARNYGRAVAELGLGLALDGRTPAAWAPSEGLASAFADHDALLRFGADPGLVPAGTEIVNPPVSVWVRYRYLIQAGITLLLLSVAVLAAFLFWRRKERTALVRANQVLEQRVAERTGELRAANAELSATNESLTLMIRRTEAMQESVLKNAREVTLGRLAASIAHGLNSPLNAIRSANDAMRFVLDPGREAGSPAPSAEDRAAVLGESTGIIAAAVDEVIESVRTVREYAAESRAARDPGAVKIRSSVERALQLFKDRLPASVALRTDFAEAPEVRGDEGSFIRLWTQLLQNALQAMGAGGELVVSVRPEGDFVAVAIDDEGEGVPPQVAGRLFEPFVTTRPPAEGMGLGLAYCRRYVESVGGTIAYAPKPRGSVFTVRIPVARGDAP